MSLARSGDTTKVEDQERICRELCERREWAVAAGIGYPEPNGAFTDNNASAWKKNRKRPGWDAMLEAVGAGKISAIVVYHGDRLARQPYDLETLINLAEGRGVKLASPTGTRDLSNNDDLFILRIEVAAQCRESAATSRRKKNEYKRLAGKGLVRPGGGGGRAFAFEKDGVTHRPDEAAIIREAAAAILEGQSPRSVLAGLTARGVRSTAGNVMGQSGFQRTLLMPRMAGLMPDGQSRAAWEPVLDRATWESLRQVVGGHAQAGRKGSPQHLLSGIARCGCCGHALWAAQRTAAKPIYRCPPDGGCGKVSRSRPLLEEYVTGHVLGRLAAAEKMPQSLPRPGLEAEFRALTEQRAETQAIIADHSKGGRLQLLMARLDSIDRRLAELRELSGEDARARLIRAHAGITREEFRALPLQVRRSLVTACVTVTVRPASRRGPGLRTQDVDVIPR